jgi:hypothetical protein
MRDIRADLRERLEATVRQRVELETRERRLRALLRDEENSDIHQLVPDGCGISGEGASGARLRAFVLGSLEDGHDWSLDDLKEHAQGLGLTTAGASGRSLNIVLVNLRREGLVVRLRNGRWRLNDQGKQFSFDLAQPGGRSEEDQIGARLAS